MKRTKLRMVSAALAACMMASVLPMGAMAQGGGEETENSVSVLDVSSTPTTDEEKIAQGWVKINKTNFPDENFRKFLLTEKAGEKRDGKKIDQDGDHWLSKDEIADVKEIACYGKRIEKLTGIEYFTALEYLDFSGNQLTELDVSKNTALTLLDCRRNELKELDVSDNKVLRNLFCNLNQLKELDVSRNTALTELGCDGNQLKELNVSQNKELRRLTCGGNQLKELDVSKNTALTDLNCGGNQLKELDVSKNEALETLWCGWNELKELDVSDNTALEDLACSCNELTSLNLEKTKVKTGQTSELAAYGNSYNIAVDPNNQFDLSTLPGDFDVSKASNWSGGTVSKGILTVDKGVDKVTYTYDCGTTQAGEHFSVWFTLNVTRDNADPVVPDAPADGGDTDDAADNIKGALSAIVVGAVAGAIIYETGTGIYRVINMPGIAMPSNRGELAMLLWEHAGKPEPVSTALYSDIDEDNTDLNKAARWAVEQGLMQDDADKNTFNPRFPVSKLRTCLTWNAAKEKGLFDTDKPAE